MVEWLLMAAENNFHNKPFNVRVHRILDLLPYYNNNAINIILLVLILSFCTRIVHKYINVFIKSSLHQPCCFVKELSKFL